MAYLSSMNMNVMGGGGGGVVRDSVGEKAAFNKHHNT